MPIKIVILFLRFWQPASLLYPCVVVEEDSGRDHGEADDDGPEVELQFVGRVAAPHHVLPAV